MTVNAQQRARHMGDRIFKTVRDNPEGLLLLAAGCALLMRSNGFASQKSQSRPAPPKERSGMSAAAETARDYVSDVAEKVGDTAQSYASSASQFADDARRSVSEKSGRFTEQAQATMRDKYKRVLQDQPLVVVFAGLAAGVAVASALPSTQIERRTMGPAGEFMADVAAKTGERLKDATLKVGEELKAEARERGLDADGLKEMAQKAAGTFGSTVAGENGSAEATSAASQSGQFQPADNPGRSQGDFASRQPAAPGWKPGSNT